MNSDFEVYQALEGEVPIEDKTRLEGFLHGRAEASLLERQRKEFEESLKNLERETKINNLEKKT